jgi:RNase H-fold protein (predicted Holliday junction resolvase)
LKERIVLLGINPLENALKNHKLKLVVIGKPRKPQYSRVPKKTASLSIIKTTREHG